MEPSIANGLLLFKSDLQKTPMHVTVYICQMRSLFVSLAYIKIDCYMGQVTFYWDISLKVKELNCGSIIVHPRYPPLLNLGSEFLQYINVICLKITLYVQACYEIEVVSSYKETNELMNTL